MAKYVKFQKSYLKIWSWKLEYWWKCQKANCIHNAKFTIIYPYSLNKILIEFILCILNFNKLNLIKKKINNCLRYKKVFWRLSGTLNQSTFYSTKYMIDYLSFWVFRYLIYQNNLWYLQVSFKFDLKVRKGFLLPS